MYIDMKSTIADISIATYIEFIPFGTTESYANSIPTSVIREIAEYFGVTSSLIRNSIIGDEFKSSMSKRLIYWTIVKYRLFDHYPHLGEDYLTNELIKFISHTPSNMHISEHEFRREGFRWFYKNGQ